MRWVPLFLLLYVNVAQAEYQTKVLQSHTGGLVTNYSGQRLQEDQATVATNIFLDKDLAVTKRLGYQLHKQVGTADGAIKGGWSYTDTGGQNYFFVRLGTNVYVTKGDGTFMVHGATVNAINVLRAKATLSKLWFSNGVDYLWYTDSVNISSATSAPLAKLIGSFKSRLVLANYPGGRSSVWLSGQGDGTDYTIPSVQVDTGPANFYLNGPNDGRQATCLFDGFRDVLILFNEDQMYGLYGNGINSFTLRMLNNQVGCLEQESLQEHLGKLRWLSKRGIEEYDGSQITKISKPIQNMVDNIVATSQQTQTLSQSSYADWQAGNRFAGGVGAPTSVDISPGNIVPSTFSHVDISSADFVLGTTNQIYLDISGGVRSGKILLNSGFEDGTTTYWHSGNDPRNYYVPDAGGSCGSTSTGTFKEGGTYAVRSFTGAGHVNRLGVTICDNTGNPKYFRLHTNPSAECNKYNFDLSTQTVSLRVYLKNGFDGGPDVNASCIYDGNPEKYSDFFNPALLVNGVFEYGIGVKPDPDNPGYNAILFDSYDPYFVKTSTYVSPCYDTSFSTPILGKLGVRISSDTNTSISFGTTVSTTCTGVFDSTSSYTLGNEIASAKKQVLKYQLGFTTTASSMTAVVSEVDLNVATTGQFITKCFNPGAAISSWGLIQASVLSDGGSITLKVSTGTGCTDVQNPLANWTTQVNNVVIGVATSTYLGVRAYWDMVYSTQVPTLQDITINYNTGLGRPSVASNVYTDRYWLAFTTNTSNNAYNDTTLVYDSMGKWSQLVGINAASLWQFQRKLYSGSALADGKVYQQDAGYTDDGNSILFQYRTPDLDLDHFGHKILRSLKVELDPVINSVLTSTMTVRYYVDKGTTPYELGQIYLGYDNSLIQGRQYFQQGDNPTTARTIAIEYLNNSYAPITLYRTKLEYLPLKWR